MELEHAKGESMIRLAGLTIAGALTVAIFIAQSPEVNASGGLAGLYAAAFAMNFLAAASFVDGYAGIFRGRDNFAAPSVSWLFQKGKDETWKTQEHALSLLASYAAYERSNYQSLQWAATRRKWGLLFLMIAITIYGATTLFIVGAAL